MIRALVFLLSDSIKNGGITDDFVFLRPSQSEAIIPQFAQLNLYKSAQFESWQTFRD